MTVRVISQKLLTSSGGNWSAYWYKYHLAASRWQLYKFQVAQHRWIRKCKPTVIAAPIPANFKTLVVAQELPVDLIHAVSVSKFPCTIRMELELGMDPWTGDVLEPTPLMEVSFSDPSDAMMFKLAHT